MKKFALICVLLIFCIPLLVSAQDRPSPEEARKVVNYYYKGQGQAAVLVDSALCTGIVKEGDNKNNPDGKIMDGSVNKGDEAYVWMQYLLPTDQEAAVTITYFQKGKPRKVHEVTVKGAFRYRVWKRLPTNKTGNWNIVIVQEMENGEEVELGQIAYTVSE